MVGTKKCLYSAETLDTALKELKNGSSVLAISKKYGIPRTTLRDKISGKYREGAKPGPSTILSCQEEALLVKWTQKLASLGFPITKPQLQDSVAELTKTLSRKNPFTGGRPGKKWFSCFLKRHPELVQRVSQNLTSARSKLTESNIRNWFQTIRTYLNSNDCTEITKDPTRIFNCDETAFFLAPKEKSVLVKRGAKQVYSRIANCEKECITVLITVSASGDMGPPMALYAYKRMPHGIVKNMPVDWGIGTSESGWMTAQTFFEYITNVFHPWIIKKNIKLPVMLYVDGHSSHISLPLSEFCEKNQIILIALFPNATHILQPCDVGLFFPLKSAWKAAVHNYRWKNDGSKLDKQNFAPLLATCLEKAAKKTTIINSFKTTGLFPFNPDGIDYCKLLNQIEPANENHPNETAVPVKETQTADETFFDILESKIAPSLLTEFQSSSSDWDGDLQHKSLFELWHKISINKDPLSRMTNDVTNPDESFWFKDGDVIDLNVLNDGTVLIADDKIMEKLATPQKQLTPNPVPHQETSNDTMYPTPFKNALYWPEAAPQSKKLRNLKKVTPVVATSKEFLAHLRNQKLDKDVKEKDIAERRLKRKLKFDEKAAKQQNSAKVAKVHKEIMASFDTGDYVVVTYEGELFPGLVLGSNTIDNQVQVKTMTMAGSNWKWPAIDDILNYPVADIVKISTPTLTNSRGFYSVPEVVSLKKK